MQRVTARNAVPVLPPPSEEGVTGYFSDGDESLGVDGTYVPATWTNGIQEEVASVIEAAGMVLDAKDNAQLLTALQKLFAAADRISWKVIVDTPTTLAGYGITDAVQQGGGTGQGANKIYIGWRTDGSGLAATVDKTDLGTIVFEAELQANVRVLNNSIAAVQQALDQDVTGLQQSLAQTAAQLQGEIDTKQPTGNYARSADGHAYAISWAAPVPHLFVDNQDQGALYCNSWYQPLVAGGVGCAFLVEEGATGAIGTIIGGLTTGGKTWPGTWMSCGGGQTNNNNWYLWLRVA